MFRFSQIIDTLCDKTYKSTLLFQRATHQIQAQQHVPGPGLSNRIRFLITAIQTVHYYRVVTLRHIINESLLIQKLTINKQQSYLDKKRTVSTAHGKGV